jgi:hypothetical protein
LSPRAALQLLVFTSGTAVMAVEMTGMRLLAPYFGTSMLVTTVLIGTLMGFLSLGYALGGKKGVVDHDALDARISRHIRKRAQVVEVGVRDEDRIDDTAARVDPREQRPCRDIPDRARASIEQDARFT